MPAESVQIRLRNCLESECEDCTEVNPLISSCAYTIRGLNQSQRGSMGVMTGNPCHYNRSFVEKESKTSSSQIDILFNEVERAHPNCPSLKPSNINLFSSQYH